MLDFLLSVTVGNFTDALTLFLTGVGDEVEGGFRIALLWFWLSWTASYVIIGSAVKRFIGRICPPHPTRWLGGLAPLLLSGLVAGALFANPWIVRPVASAWGDAWGLILLPLYFIFIGLLTDVFVLRLLPAVTGWRELIWWPSSDRWLWSTVIASVLATLIASITFYVAFEYWAMR